VIQKVQEVATLAPPPPDIQRAKLWGIYVKYQVLVWYLYAFTFCFGPKDSTVLATSLPSSL
jgi:hypothetical protein